MGGRTTAYEHDYLLYIFGVSQLLMIYAYSYLCWAWTLKHMIDEMFCVERGSLEHMSTYLCVEQESLEHMSVYVCVERESLEHMIYENLCIEPEALKHMKILLGIVGNNPWSLPS